MPNPPKPPGSIDFEVTDFDEARRVADELPDGLKALHELASGYWVAKRRSPVPTDRALTGVTMYWITKLPPDVRPISLCEKYPRIANAIAQEWSTPDGCRSLLADLLRDRRGRRMGFPTAVRLELTGLEAFLESLS